MKEVAEIILMWRNIRNKFLNDMGLQINLTYNSLEEELEDLIIFMEELQHGINIELGKKIIMKGSSTKKEIFKLNSNMTAEEIMEHFKDK